MNKKIKMIVADIDGTLAEHSILSKFTIDTINEIHKNGYLFGIASGRPAYQLSRTIREWGLDFEPEAIIGMNGAQLYDKQKDEIEAINYLSCEDIKKAIEFMKPYEKDTNLFIYEGKGCMFEKDDQEYLKALDKYGEVESFRLAESYEDFYAEPNAKLLYRLYDTGMMKEIEDYVSSHVHPEFYGFKTQDNLYELANPKTNKGAAVIRFAQSHGFDISEVAGFGDMSNDYEMIDVCGMGVCLLNGSDDCKSVADYITEEDCEHNGFANFVHKYIFEDDLRG
ncbi:MAG: HAD-IIB family hydrolase [Erysipelotrichaceae bacterium]|nr:HAD-IIB family hydrolase [Erysipelotrichaceae bacterium]